jgi:hypothetical protein
MREAATAEALVAGSAATSAVDSTVATTSTAVVDFMAAVAFMVVAATGKTIRVIQEKCERLAACAVSRFACVSGRFDGWEVQVLYPG